MYAFIKGVLSEIKAGSVVIESNGIGYEIIAPLQDIASLSEKKGTDVLLYTYLVHREDQMALYGFVSEKSKNGFLSLLKVSGIGPKVAIKILSHLDADSLYACVEKEDAGSLKNIPGIGPKTANQIIFDLKGVIPSSLDVSKDSVFEKDLIHAMVNLGYRESDVRSRIKELKPLSDKFEIEFKRLLKHLAGK